MLTIRTENAAPDTVIVHLQGKLTIETVAELREALLEIVGGVARQVYLDGNMLTTIDFFGIQLLCSAHRTAVSRNKELAWFNNRPLAIDESIRSNGFSRHCGCPLCPPGGQCMWV